MKTVSMKSLWLAPILASMFTAPASAATTDGRAIALGTPADRTPIDLAHTPGDADSIFRITTPGSYFLRRSFVGRSGKHGIEVAASNVTIDLNGHTLTGIAAALSGIHADGPAVDGVRVLNGTVSSWPSRGLDLTFAKSSTLEALSLTDNGSHGAIIGTGGIVRACQFDRNGSHGLSFGASSMVESSVANENANNGFNGSTGASLEGCTARSNGGRGIYTTSGATLRGCSAASNGSEGIFAPAGTVSECIAYQNQLDGIKVSSGVVRGSHANENGGHGFSGAAAQVLSCRARDNDLTGIEITSGLVVDCVATSNNQGIAVGSRATVRGNHAYSNIGTGIRVEGSQSFVGANTAAQNGTNYFVPTGNSYGPIVTQLGPTSTDSPWANFSF